MCRAVKCRKCGKTTWAGCGMHVDQVMSGVPRADRCPGHQNEKPAPKQSKKQGQAGAKQGVFAKLFGR